MDIIHEVNGWHLTDDSCFQYVKEEGDDVFSLIEMNQCSLDDMGALQYEIYTDTIDIEDYLEIRRSELEAIVKHFGYKSTYEVADLYGDKVYQILCECVFEHYGSFQANQIYVGNYINARKKLMDYITTN